MLVDGLAGLVTGAASGLGFATVCHLSSRGARLVMVDRDEKRLLSKRNQLSGDAIAAPADVCEPDSVAAAIQRGIGEFGEIRFVINCAGIASAERTLSRGKAHDVGLWKQVIDVNLTGSFNVLRLAAERMVDNGPDANGQRGVIINTSSIAAFDGQTGQVAYSASKAAIAGMSLPIARDLAEHGIRCMAIAPGVFETELLAGIPPKGLTALRKGLLFPDRMGAPEEFAQLCAHILENPYINGTCYRLDGGTRLGH